MTGFQQIENFGEECKNKAERFFAPCCKGKKFFAPTDLWQKTAALYFCTPDSALFPHSGYAGTASEKRLPKFRKLRKSRLSNSAVVNYPLSEAGDPEAFHPRLQNRHRFYQDR
jgi:hypothetical protein